MNVQTENLRLSSNEDLRQQLRNQLGENNLTTSDAFAQNVAGDQDAPVPFEVSFQENGRLVGGLVGSVRRRWLEVDVLWVDAESRGRGLGGLLLDRAEQEALRMGAQRAKLTTFDFQAPAFYKARGYTVYGMLDDYPEGCTLYLLRKDLRGDASCKQ